MLTVAETRARRRSARQRDPWRRPELPLAAVLIGYPLWALLGLGQAIWLAAGAVMAVRLLGARRVRLPRGIGIWAAFVGWVCVSALQLVDRVGSLVGAGYRVGVYAAAGVVLVYVYNLSERQLATEKVLRWVAVPLGVLTVGGVAGMLLGERDLVSVPLALIPGAADTSAFLADLLTPRFAQVQTFLGFELPRPAFPFRFTNQWGSVMAVLVPFTLAGLRYQRPRHRTLVQLVLVLAVVPIVVSVNRGLWMSLGVTFLYVVVRRAGAGRGASTLRLVLGVSVVVLFVTLSPLGDLISERAGSDHSNRSRSTLYSLTLEQVDESPLVGFGAPRPDDENPNLPPVGTHGQLWTVLFSHGWVGAALFVMFLAMLAWRTGHDLDDVDLWLHAIVVGLLVQMWFYNLFPGALVYGFLAAALLLRRDRLGVRRR